MSETEAALRQELEEVKRRFSDWKARTKAAVERERQKLLDLSEQNENLSKVNTVLNSRIDEGYKREVDLRNYVEKLRVDLETAQREAATTAQESLDWMAEKKNSDAMLGKEKEEQAQQLQHEKEHLRKALEAANERLKNMEEESKSQANEASTRFAEYTEQFASFSCATFAHLSSVHSSFVAFEAKKATLCNASVEHVLREAIIGLTGSVAEANAMLERQKRNMERTMKLATRDQDGAKAENEGLRETIKVLEEEIGHQRNSVKQRDLAIESLELRLDEATSALSLYETQTAATANQGQYIADLEQRVVGMEREFGEREAILHEHHRDEVDRLLAKHEDEMAEVKGALEEQINDLVFQLQQSARAQHVHKPAGGNDYAIAGGDFMDSDSAYEDLLAENTRMREDIERANEARRNTQKELAEAKEKLSRFESVPSFGPHADTTNMDPSFMRRKIFDLEKQVASLGEQLMQANQELIEHKAAAKERSSSVSSHHQSFSSPFSDSNVAGGLSSHQQQAYMKAVLVKMLCARSDDVKSSLLPVISTLVKFSNEELKVIYTANPNWIH